ncbi:MAG: hypothetical protein LUC16_04015, partial [Coprobacillus sp.]|nr:hypothetical protein [Coprobacillus sp.]
MKKSLLSISLIALVSLGLSSCVETPLIYGEEGTTWIVEGGDRPTGHIGDEHTEHTYDEGEVTKEATCTE